jgi:hypothetical protein
MKDLLIIVPTRNRKENARLLYDAHFKNSYKSDLCFGIDDDDTTEYEIFDDVIYEVGPRISMGNTLNSIAKKYMNDYRYLSFMGDDHRPRTKEWDVFLTDPLKNKVGVSYGNDLLQGKNIPTAVVLSSEIVKELGFMVPPVLRHFFFDNYWKELGEGINRLHYMDDVIIEHMHPLNNKSSGDETYGYAWSQLDHDTPVYDEYRIMQLKQDIEKIKSIL